MKAIWNNQIIAETDRTLEVEGNHYFPQDDVKLEFLSTNEDCEECSWKGLTTTFGLEVSGKDLPNSVWYYPNPKEDAIQVSGYMAFSDQVELRA